PAKAMRPFDANRDGFVCGEGAGIVVLESLAYASARDARIYAEIVGYGMTGDAHHMTAPDPEGDGAARAMAAALRDAELDVSAVGYINAHGTSTPYNDKFETLAIKRVFGDHARRLGYRSRDPLLLEQALTHASYANEHPPASDHEPLAFLGDAALALVVTEHVTAADPAAVVGVLTPRRAELVAGTRLARWAIELE